MDPAARVRGRAQSWWVSPLTDPAQPVHTDHQAATQPQGCPLPAGAAWPAVPPRGETHQDQPLFCRKTEKISPHLLKSTV